LIARLPHHTAVPACRCTGDETAGFERAQQAQGRRAVQAGALGKLLQTGAFVVRPERAQQSAGAFDGRDVVTRRGVLHL